MNQRKKIINCNLTDPNKILPFQYPWARVHYKTGVANNWTPEEVPMQQDIELWNKQGTGSLTDNEKKMILWNLGFFSTAESLTANNIVLAIYRHVTNPECRQYLLRQGYEEAIHTDTFIYICDSLGLDPDEVYNMYQNTSSIKAKDDFVVAITESILDPNFKTDTVENIQKFVSDLIGYYIIMEGIFFYAGFAMMLSLLRQNRMIGIGEQFQYILRDETTHLAFGADLINTIVEENPEIWTDEFRQTIVENIQKAVKLEVAYAEDALPIGIMGLNSEIIKEYMEHIADRRLERINLQKIYNAGNPFPWMSEIVDLKKEKNFFETRVTEYQTGGNLDWD
ncbi:ribonucleoside-diphosphate reductase [Candidatus Falkowbacteria bacterium RIFOXYD2_FULL_35_9]|uniref:Ribonucleoside-diphosphate reductase subunit beta n=1 Tax=Candidatus Falkowbacteria bacterium RIFOXYC2_FULL_36_12 TaxID=1798002 RepID=A0A1F5SWA9_9BACT|nr:MAG: ribonucleoside-diphosphate reductase [Candidatus Falkowbacteria bacterium RIFOXYC2_FULL_36_12]OGF31189.1 MAG: ribonucleoside-diphosphate reductase [Candidatus Falkowbacteria bacterium RIFOXYB2_FULL_35_7]OGF34442.1 MAG: ribonucleoside-diphosphate reductase [Candidatus Falkowbacteria bacterium RIFOXYA2_FULL_35_8]OGF47563.1 MAG: ribonucleoside-diphosphate reductase [Candidatus Falkowbacteria bacterium RIFOXYD2_FULL_35_9]